MKKIQGGVTAAKGFRASGIHCGIRRNRDKKDLSLIVSERICTAAAVYTQNLVKGAPLLVTKKHLENGYARAVICNSGNANTCNRDGMDVAEQMGELTAEALGIDASDVVVASTGVIGQPLDITPIKNGMGELVASLGDNSRDAALGIMTTDLAVKEAAVEFEIAGKVCRMGGIAKGSGMIHPNMATMLIFITTDCAVSHDMLRRALSEDVKHSFNMISIDGDMSTNDMVTILANGMAENAEIKDAGAEFDTFCAALREITVALSKMIAKDGEGATKLLQCAVIGAKTESAAKTVAKSVICSSLTKAAMFGADANWGRVLAAIGYSGADVDISRVDVSFVSRKGMVSVCENGTGLEFPEHEAKKILKEDEIDIIINLNDGSGKAVAWGCDLTYDYVRINGDYRT